jgi:hypothetical protein
MLYQAFLTGFCNVRPCKKISVQANLIHRSAKILTIVNKSIKKLGVILDIVGHSG